MLKSNFISSKLTNKQSDDVTLGQLNIVNLWPLGDSPWYVSPFLSNSIGRLISFQLRLILDQFVSLVFSQTPASEASPNIRLIINCLKTKKKLQLWLFFVFVLDSAKTYTQSLIYIRLSCRACEFRFDSKCSLIDLAGKWLVFKDFKVKSGRLTSTETRSSFSWYYLTRSIDRKVSVNLTRWARDRAIDEFTHTLTWITSNSRWSGI